MAWKQKELEHLIWFRKQESESGVSLHINNQRLTCLWARVWDSALSTTAGVHQILIEQSLTNMMKQFGNIKMDEFWVWRKLTPPFFFRLRLVTDDDDDAVDNTGTLPAHFDLAVFTGVLTMSSCKLDGIVSNLQSLEQRCRRKWWGLLVTVHYM